MITITSMNKEILINKKWSWVLI